MKKRKKIKLSLNKEKISDLNNLNKRKIMGGTGNTYPTCHCGPGTGAGGTGGGTGGCGPAGSDGCGGPGTYPNCGGGGAGGTTLTQTCCLYSCASCGG